MYVRVRRRVTCVCACVRVCVFCTRVRECEREWVVECARTHARHTRKHVLTIPPFPALPSDDDDSE